MGKGVRVPAGMVVLASTSPALAAKPNNLGPAMVHALGATAARKGGAQFRWKAVE
jgi:hypothetical protein